ncbi:MAG: glycosyltransferase family 39 protein [Deltaproteobacteria bacterium]
MTLFASLTTKRAVTWTIVIGAILRIQGLGWDNWLNFHPDERNLVTAAQALAFPGAMIPSFHAYNGLALMLPKALAFVVCGGDPSIACVTWAARLLSAVFASLAVLVGVRIAVRLGGEMAALPAALLLAFSAPLIQWAHFGTTESALSLTVLVLWLSALRFAEGRDSIWRAAVVWGVTLGLGLGMKTTAGIFALIPLLAVALNWRILDRQAVPAALLCAIVALVLFVVTTPALIFAREDYFNVMRFEGDVVSGRADVFWTWQFTHARNVVYEASQLWRLLDGSGLMLAGLGVFAALWARNKQSLPALLLMVIYLAVISLWHAKFTRYLAPVLPILLVFAALSAARMMVLRRFPATLKTVLVIALALPVLTGSATAISYRAPDPRVIAAERLSARIRPGETVLVEPREVGIMGFDRADLLVLPLSDPPGVSKLEQIASDLNAGDWMLIYSRRNWAVLPGLRERFPEMCGYYSALARGDLGYIVVNKFERAAPFGALLAPDLGSEETRTVFDGPTVYLLQNTDHLSAADLKTRIDQAPQDCTPATLLDLFERHR